MSQNEGVGGRVSCSFCECWEPYLDSLQEQQVASPVKLLFLTGQGGTSLIRLLLLRAVLASKTAIHITLEELTLSAS